MLVAMHRFFNSDKAGRIGRNYDAVDHILGVTAAVLHLGNIEIQAGKEGESCVTSGASGKALEWVAKLWKLPDVGKLVAAINHETREVNKKDILMNLSSEKAEERRDTMARHVYDSLFVWIVEQCSTELSSGPKCNPGGNYMLGVLDIFGFEFVVDDMLDAESGRVLNGMDQYAINLCNEVLQQCFINVVFNLEQVLY